MSYNDPWSDNNIPSVNAELESVISSLSQISNPQSTANTNNNNNTNNGQLRASQQIGSYRRNSMASNSDGGSEHQSAFQQAQSLDFQSAMNNNNNNNNLNVGHSGNSPVLRRTTLSVGGFSLNGASSNAGGSSSPIVASANNLNNNVNSLNNKFSSNNRLVGYAASIGGPQNTVHNMGNNSISFNYNSNGNSNSNVNANANANVSGAGNSSGSFFENFGKQLVEATKEVELNTNVTTDEDVTVQQFVTSSSRSASLQVDAYNGVSDSRQNSNILENNNSNTNGEKVELKSMEPVTSSIKQWNPETARSFYPSSPMGIHAGPVGIPFNGLYNPLGVHAQHHHHHHPAPQGKYQFNHAAIGHGDFSNPQLERSETDKSGNKGTTGSGAKEQQQQEIPTPINSPPFFINPYLSYGVTPPPMAVNTNPDLSDNKDGSNKKEQGGNKEGDADLVYLPPFDPRQYPGNNQMNPYHFQVPQDYPYGNGFFHPMGIPPPGSPVNAAHPNMSFANNRSNKGNPYLKHNSKNNNNNNNSNNNSFKNKQGLSSIPVLNTNSTSSNSSTGSVSNKTGFNNSKNNAKRRKEPVYRSPKLEEFIQSSKETNHELGELYGHAYEFCKDQVGSRFIQDKLPFASDADKEMIFNEIREQALELMDDVFGNYVIQMFFELGSEVQKETLVQSVLGNVLKLTQSQYGCRIIQKSLVYVKLEQKIKIVDELKEHVFDCIKDQNGNHVIQKAIENIPLEKLPYISDSLKGQIYHFSTHPYGCRVVQRILEFGGEKDRQLVLDELKDFYSYLIQNEFGNYVIQYILKSSKNSSTDDMLDVKQAIVDLVCQKIVEFSCHKYASNVVEQILFLGNDSQKRQLFSVIIPKTEEDALELKDSEFIAIMMKDQYANYVIQKLVKVTTGQDKKLLIISIRSYLDQVKSNHAANNNNGRKQKHLASVEKLASLVSNLSI